MKLTVPMMMIGGTSGEPRPLSTASRARQKAGIFARSPTANPRPITSSQTPMIASATNSDAVAHGGHVPPA